MKKPAPSAKPLQESSIAAAVSKSALKDDESIRGVVNALLSEAAGVPQAGDTVAVIDDPVYGISGAKGKVKGQTRNKSGFVDVEMESGVVVPCMSMLLIKL